jgi:hypothetical protein
MGYLAGVLSVPITFFFLWVCFMIYEIIKNGFRDTFTKKYLWHAVTEVLYDLFIGSLLIIIFVGLAWVISIFILNFLKTI